MVDDLPRGHVEAGVLCAESVGQRADDLVIGAALARRVDEFRADLDEGMAARLIEVVVFQEHGCRENDVRPTRGLGHELLVRADEQIVAGETTAHAIAVRAHGQRVLVLNQ